MKPTYYVYEQREPWLCVKVGRYDNEAEARRHAESSQCMTYLLTWHGVPLPDEVAGFTVDAPIQIYHRELIR